MERDNQCWQAYEMYYTVDLTYVQIGLCFDIDLSAAADLVKREFDRRARIREAKRTLNDLAERTKKNANTS